MTYLKPHSFMGTLVSPSLLLSLEGLLVRVEGQSGPGREAAACPLSVGTGLVEGHTVALARGLRLGFVPTSCWLLWAVSDWGCELLPSSHREFFLVLNQPSLLSRWLPPFAQRSQGPQALCPWV